MDTRGPRRRASSTVLGFAIIDPCRSSGRARAAGRLALRRGAAGAHRVGADARAGTCAGISRSAGGVAAVRRRRWAIEATWHSCSSSPCDAAARGVLLLLHARPDLRGGVGAQMNPIPIGVHAGAALAARLRATWSCIRSSQVFCANYRRFRLLRARVRQPRRLLERRRLLRGRAARRLTGLLNRTALEQARLRAADAQIARLPVSVLLIDIDHFKRFNDRYGHQAVTCACSRSPARSAVRGAAVAG